MSRPSKSYKIKNKKKKHRVSLTRADLADILLCLGPTDSTDALYNKINKRFKVF